MRTLSLKMKLILSFMTVGLLPMVGVGLYSFVESADSLEKDAYKRLVAVKNVKGEAVKGYFDTIKSQVLTFSHSVMVEEAMVAFKDAFESYHLEAEITDKQRVANNEKMQAYYVDQFDAKFKKENSGRSSSPVELFGPLSVVQKDLQYQYIAGNPNPLGGKEALDFAPDGTTYSKVHQKYHPTVREFLQKFGYYDIFLVDIKTGEIIYSVFKELDYATSLLTGPYSKTNFADAFRQASKIEDKESVVLVDYKQYLPSYNSPASFIATPIWKGGEKIGVAIFQMPIDRLNTVMGERSGLGETGETYLVGSDKRTRSDSYLDNERLNVVSSFKSGEKGLLVSPTVNNVLKGESGNWSSENYLGDKVLASYAPIDILGLKWGLVAEIHQSEALKDMYALQKVLTIVSVTVAVLILLFSLFMSKVISSDVYRRVGNVSKKLADASSAILLSSQGVSATSTTLKDSSATQASSLQETVSSINEISAMVQKSTDAAQGSTQVSQKSLEAAEKGKETVQLMLNAIGEISDSNQEIMDEMTKSNEEISKIVKVISDIGEKTKVINDIVFQTKLLSFNASVEAARAGEHGKGFAVVAEEVGNLASMSGKAAHEITEMLEGSIKQVTDIADVTKKNIDTLVEKGRETIETGKMTANECVGSLDEIMNNVKSVTEITQEIAGASAEQASGVKEITLAMQQLDEISHKNSTVAAESSNMAEELRTNAAVLEESISDLRAIVGGAEVKEKTVKSAPKTSKTKEVEARPKSKVNVISLTEKASNKAPEKVTDKPIVQKAKKESNPSAPIEEKVAVGQSFTPSKDDDRFEDF